MDFKDHFSRHAELYRRYRPSYPDAVFAWLASLTPGRALALDVGTGNGQAAVKLADHFDHVLATDASAAQVEAATPHTKVDYRVARAEDSGLADSSVDLVLAAQAFHWFDFDAFFAECRRVVRPGGVVAALTYFHPTITPTVDAVLADYIAHVRADWPPERRFVDARYTNVPWPFDEVKVPSFEMTLDLDLDGFLGYLATWSAAQRYRERTSEDPRASFIAPFSEAWGDPHRPNLVRFPLGGRVGLVR
jgi:SAM-dependent methyltransferase